MDEINRLWKMYDQLGHTDMWKASFITAQRNYCVPLEDKNESRTVSLKRYDNGYTAQWVDDHEPVLYNNRWVKVSDVEKIPGAELRYLYGRTVSGFAFIRLSVFDHRASE